MLALDRSLELCDQISSGAPQAFSKCLLGRKSVAPGLSAEHYQKVFKDATPEFLALASPDPGPLPVVDEDEDGIIAPGIIVPVVPVPMLILRTCRCQAQV